MTRSETGKIVAVIKKCFQGYYKDYTVEDLNDMVNIWEMMLGDYSYEEVNAGLTVFIRSDKSGYPPTPGQLIDHIHKLKEKPENRLDEGQAWSLVWKAICDSNYHASERFSELPPLVQRAVGSPEVLKGWAQTDIKDSEFLKNDFQRAYRTAQDRHTEEAKIPESVKVLMENITGHLPQIEG